MDCSTVKGKGNPDQQNSLYFAVYPKVLQEAISKILTLPTVVELLSKVCKAGEIYVIADKGIAPGEAGWHSGKRTIHFNLEDINEDRLPTNKKIYNLLFELNNAEKSTIFEMLQSSAGKLEIDLDTYVEQLEKMEFLTLRTTQKMIADGVRLGIIEPVSDTATSVESFEVYYAFQQAGGHSQQAAKHIKEIYPNIKSEYKGTLGPIPKEDYEFAREVINIVAKIRWGTPEQKEMWNPKTIQVTRQVMFEKHQFAMLKLFDRLMAAK